MSNAPWRLEELVERAARALAHGAEGDSRRVRWMPDSRTARFYTTLGLLDRPAEFRGRTAFYGDRHLLQLVAIKRLQAAGLTLEEVQRRLAGLPEDRLRALAELPAQRAAGSGAEGPSSKIGQASGDPRLRGPGTLAAAALPEPPSAQPPSPAGRFWDAAPARPAPPSTTATPVPATALLLAPGVRLVLDAPAGSLSPAHAQAVAESARSLLRKLDELGLLEPHDIP